MICEAIVGIQVRTYEYFVACYQILIVESLVIHRSWLQSHAIYVLNCDGAGAVHSTDPWTQVREATMNIGGKL